MPIPQLDKKSQNPAKKAGVPASNARLNKAQVRQNPAGKKAGKAVKAGKKPKSRKRLVKKLLLAVIVLGMFSLLGIGAMFAIIAQDLPDPDKISDRAVAQSTRIYARDGSTLLYEIHGDENRTLVKYEDIPQYAVQATIAIEDDEFYKHHGFDWKGLVRAVFSNIFSGNTTGQGGSTLTQQFVKNAIVGTEKTYTRKIKELVLSIELEQIYSKEEILQLYFNEIPYGSTAYGIESASQYYFGKSVKDITLPEAAILAALPQSPTYYSPFGSHVDALMARKNKVLDRMAELGYITKEEAETAKTTEVAFAERREDINAAHFVFYVKQQLVDTYGEKMVEQGGLKVVTSLDWDKQKIAEQAVNDGMEKIRAYNGSNSALVSIDPKTGQVLAMVGSYDYFAEDIDGQVNVTIRERQPGSSIKPVSYMTAYSIGFTPNTAVWDVETDFPTDSGNYHPRNYDLSQHGPITMKEALLKSLNIPAVKTLYLIGMDRFLASAEALGYTTFDEPSRYGLALTLGGGEVTLLEHTSAYATFATEGSRHPVSPILKVEDPNGQVLYEWQDKSDQVVDKDAVKMLTYSLQGGWVTLSGRPVAGKTGTTNDYRDEWALGYTPSLAAGVWVGNNDNSEMSSGAAASLIAVPIFRQYMENALAGSTVESFPQPTIPDRSNPMLNGAILRGEKKWVDKETKKLIPDECLETYPAEWKEEKEFKLAHSELYYINKEDVLGAKPTNPAADPAFNNWEAAVRRWAEGKQDQGYILNDEEALGYENCKFRDPSIVPTLKINAPTGTIEKDKFVIDVEFAPGEGRTIAKVDYLIDNVVVDTKTAEPFDSTYKGTTLSKGNHTFTLRVTDNASISAELSTNFVYKEEVTGTLSVVSPTGGEVTLPIKVRALVPDLTDVTEVRFFFYDKTTNSGHTQFGSVMNPTSNYPEVMWTTVPTPGQYGLYVKVIKNSGPTPSGSVVVTVK